MTWTESAPSPSPSPPPGRAWPVAFACAVALAVVLGGLGYTIGASQAAPNGAQPGAAAGPSGAADAEADPSTGEALAPLARLYEELTSEAVEVPDETALVEGAAQGMVDALGDDYADYYDREEYAEFNDFLGGTFSGVGMLLEETPDGLVVVTVFDDTPAAEAGVEEGARIVSVDGRDVRDLPIEQIVNLIKGEAGSEVTVGFEGGDSGPRELTMERREIALPTITQDLLDDGTGYVHLLQFSEDAGQQVREAVNELLDQGANGIVLDLRGNPGGLLREAVDVASLFLEEGQQVVSVQERIGERDVLEATGGALTDVPLVVLIDGGSASASEIVAGAVQDADRGTLVGERSFGKGTVQTITSLPDGGGVKFTTARYFTPSGDSIEEVGVMPDRRVEGEQAQLEAAQEELQSLVAAGDQAGN